ncbi:MAG: O-antigen ligase family protein [bacterium]|nr:O-antigen ligase family protein [bacterium]
MIAIFSQPNRLLGSLIFIALLGLGFATSWAMQWTGPLIVLAAFMLVLIVLGVYKSPWLALLAITFFLPFERIGSYDVAGITVRVSQVLAILLIAAWFARGIINRDLHFHKNPLTIPFLIFLIINLISITQAANLERSLLVFGFTVFTIFFGWMIPQLVTDETRLRKIINVLLLTAGLVSLFGLWQFFGDLIGLPTEITGLREHYTKAVFGFPRVQSTALEPLYFANFLLLPISLIYAFFISRMSKMEPKEQISKTLGDIPSDQPQARNHGIPRRWLFPLLILVGLNMVLTVSRGGYLGTALLIAVISLFYFRRFFHWKFILPVGVALIAIWFLAVYALGFGDVFQNNLDTFTGHVSNVFSGPAYIERIETFEGARRAWMDSPWIGIGPGQYGPYVSVHPYVVPEEGWKIVNNEFIELLAETGILGLIAFVTILSMLIARSIKAVLGASDPFLRAVMIALLAALLGVIAQYQTFSILYIMHVWFLVGLTVAAQNIILTRKVE